MFYAGLIGLWQIVAALKLWPQYLFPTPVSVYESLRDGFTTQQLWIAIGISLKRVLVGYAISCALGLILGFMTARSRFMSDTLGRLFVSLQSLPSICWLPIAILWFGLSEKAILFVIIMGSVLSIAISVEAGLRGVPNIYLMAGQNLGARGIGLGLHVLLPASMPHLVSGLKQGWAFAWRSLISGEMIFVTLGLGQVLMVGRDLNDISQVFAVMLLIVAIGWLFDAVCFRLIEQALRKRWGFASI
jgi:NitT/TauT family transport system permease protein